MKRTTIGENTAEKLGFQPVLTGSDINVYGMARAFYEEYGIQSISFAKSHMLPTQYSRFVDVHAFDDFDQPESFAHHLLEYARQMRAEHPNVKLLLIPCGDVYANLLSQTAEQLKDFFIFNTLPPELNHQLSMKNSFYELCEKYDIPHPATKVVDKKAVEAHEYEDLPFSFPVAMKPADSAAWLKVDFPGRKKAFIIETPEELDELIQRSYAAGYEGRMILQDFIPGDDTHMRVLNAYVDQHHNVRMMFLGHPLLEDPTPEAVGNYAAIIPDYNEEICLKLKAFLEDIGYQGVANFDMKYDERDGQFKLFEINLRQGRSSYYVTLNGFNLARYFTEDLIFDTPFDGETLIGKGDKLWLEIPRTIFKTYVRPGEDKTRGLQMLREGNWGTTLESKDDMNVKRWLMIRRIFFAYIRRYRQFFTHKEELK
ncbi:carboxylate--amine ligase [Alloscardovia macacae]|uniref:Carboxylate--amine ligase n=1 Tax=Alloscardovia macacae TaxID=1160091 RepID=A0A1Y2SY75_9BIFI|nr:carboxylate--amine ligase [Alloscardovia macacae]OTA26783.1 carboxylate--amine ligase [Alloscardovia macacae]OTA29191.1 carboxylate--amine ligase [Alloscardovia macacae]